MGSAVLSESLHYGGEDTLFYRFPRKFWVTLGATVFIFLISLFNWVSVVDSYYCMTEFRFVEFTVSFGLFSIWFNHGDAAYWIYSSLSQAYPVAFNWFLILNLFRFLLPIIFLVAIAILVTAVIKYKSKLFMPLSYLGFGIAILVPIAFYGLLMLVNSQNVEMGIDPDTLQQVVVAQNVTILDGATMVPWPLIVMFFAILPMFLLRKDDKVLTATWHQKAFYLMIIPVMIYVFVFAYLPLSGWQMAFQNFRPGRAVQEWVGFEQFEFLFTGGHGNAFRRIMTNTIGMSLINLVLHFTTAIFLALMINEVRQRKFKRVVQTISYLPHFLSWVVAAALIRQVLASDGIVNDIFMRLGLRDEPHIYLLDTGATFGLPNFWWMIGWSNVWKSVGWNTIIYLAAITAIDPELYESAEIDGAGRFRKMWNITLPGIKPTILVLLIMNLGWLLNIGFEVQFLLETDLTRQVAETIDLFVIRWGMAMRNYSLATAVGMFRTVVAIILITAANQASKRFAGEALI